MSEVHEHSYAASRRLALAPAGLRRFCAQQLAPYHVKVSHLYLDTPAQRAVVQHRDLMAALYLNTRIVHTTRLQRRQQQLNIHHLQGTSQHTMTQETASSHLHGSGVVADAEPQMHQAAPFRLQHELSFLQRTLVSPSESCV
jgi:hypothetical protein